MRRYVPIHLAAMAALGTVLALSACNNDAATNQDERSKTLAANAASTHVVSFDIAVPTILDGSTATEIHTGEFEVDAASTLCKDSSTGEKICFKTRQDGSPVPKRLLHVGHIEIPTSQFFGSPDVEGIAGDDPSAGLKAISGFVLRKRKELHGLDYLTTQNPQPGQLISAFGATDPTTQWFDRALFFPETNTENQTNEDFEKNFSDVLERLGNRNVFDTFASESDRLHSMSACYTTISGIDTSGAPADYTSINYLELDYGNETVIENDKSVERARIYQIGRRPHLINNDPKTAMCQTIRFKPEYRIGFIRLGLQRGHLAKLEIKLFAVGVSHSEGSSAEFASTIANRSEKDFVIGGSNRSIEQVIDVRGAAQFAGVYGSLLMGSFDTGLYHKPCVDALTSATRTTGLAACKIIHENFRIDGLGIIKGKADQPVADWLAREHAMEKMKREAEENGDRYFRRDTHSAKAVVVLRNQCSASGDFGVYYDRALDSSDLMFWNSYLLIRSCLPNEIGYGVGRRLNGKFCTEEDQITYLNLQGRYGSNLGLAAEYATNNYRKNSLDWEVYLNNAFGLWVVDSLDNLNFNEPTATCRRPEASLFRGAFYQSPAETANLTPNRTAYLRTNSAHQANCIGILYASNNQCP